MSKKYDIREKIKTILKRILGDYGSEIFRKILIFFTPLYDFISSTHEKIIINLKINFKLTKTLPDNFKIGMAVLAFERPEYLELCLNSLYKTKLYDYDLTILIQDDGSKDPRVKNIIEKRRNPNIKTIKYYTVKGPNNAGAAINKAVKKLITIENFDIIGWCDSDCLHHPEWLDKTIKIARWAKINHKQHILGPFSSFNSSDSSHKILGAYSSPFGDYIVKKQMGMLNYFYYKEDLLKLGFFEENENDEMLMTKKLNKLRVRNFCTKTSYVEHLGEDSILNKWRVTPVKKAVHALNPVVGGWEN